MNRASVWVMMVLGAGNVLADPSPARKGKPARATSDLAVTLDAPTSDGSGATCIIARVTNIGRATSLPTRWQWELSRSGEAGPWESFSGEDLQALAPGEDWKTGARLPSRDDLAGVDVLVRATVDPEGALAEADRANNSASVPVRAPASPAPPEVPPTAPASPLPDLVPLDVSVRLHPGGDHLELRWRLANRGTASAGACTVRWRRIVHATRSGWCGSDGFKGGLEESELTGLSTFLGSPPTTESPGLDHDPLDAGSEESTIRTMYWPIDPDAFGGRITVQIEVDAGETIVEDGDQPHPGGLWNGANNATHLSLDLGPAPEAPDPAIRDLRLAERRGRRMLLTADLVNEGTAPAGALTLSWRANSRAADVPGNTYDGLHPGESRPIEIPVIITSADVARGSIRFHLEARTLDDRSTTNNVAEIEVPLVR